MYKGAKKNLCASASFFAPLRENRPNQDSRKAAKKNLCAFAFFCVKSPYEEKIL